MGELQELIPQIEIRERGWPASSERVDAGLTKENVVLLLSKHSIISINGKTKIGTRPNSLRTAGVGRTNVGSYTKAGFSRSASADVYDR